MPANVMRNLVLLALLSLGGHAVAATPLDLLNQAFAAVGNKTEVCRQQRDGQPPLAQPSLKRLQQFPQAQVITFLDFAYEQTMNRCMQPELGELLLLHAELRQTSADNGLLATVAQQQALLISPTSVERRLQYQALPAAVRVDLETMTEFHQPFDGMTVMAQLYPE